MDTLYVCLEYRNRAAHGGRIYNYVTPAKFRFNSFLHGPLGVNEEAFRKGCGHAGLKTLLMALSMFDNPAIAISFKDNLLNSIEEHCKIYPQDKEYLEEQFDITK